jgi:Methyltransferase domain
MTHHYLSIRAVMLIGLIIYMGANLAKGPTHSDGTHARETTVAHHVPDTNFDLASQESLGYFDDIPEADWLRSKDWARRQVDHVNPERPRTHFDNFAYWHYINFHPAFACTQPKRVGGVGDGAKWVCDPHRLVRMAEKRKAAGEPGPHCIIYSVGSNGNYQFEDGMIREIGTICEIHIFDYSNNYERPQNKQQNIHFHQWGLQASNADRKGGEFYSFPQILKKLGHEKKTIDIFKIDCEGCEFSTQKDWINKDIRQVLIETHPSKNWPSFLKYFQDFKKNQFAMFYKEPNGASEGKCNEYSFLKLHPQFWKKPVDGVSS